MGTGRPPIVRNTIVLPQRHRPFEQTIDMAVLQMGAWCRSVVQLDEVPWVLYQWGWSFTKLDSVERLHLRAR